ncbi:hypothetical protein CBS101457_001856 [Exobasidium rhododendri]|nr:hypothetical protein CBS101457_001856 [Exobasidium rhododendri]
MQKPALPSDSASADAVPCPQCQTTQTSFYCTSCLSERLIWQHANYRRLQEERQKIRGRVETHLGLNYDAVESTAQRELPNPFGEPAAESREHRRKVSSPITSAHHGASTLDRIARATQVRLNSKVEQHLIESQKRTKGALEKRRKLAEKRQEVARRRTLLETAQLSLVGLVETEAQEQNCFSHDKVEKLGRLIVELKEESIQVAKEIANARAKLAREAYSLYDIRAPSSSLANIRAKADQPKGPGRSQRSTERYTAGAFAIDFTSAFDLGRSFRDNKPKDNVGNINDWTIVGLVLPVPSDVKRFERNEINGAIDHVVQLLQLVTAYLGIALPFVISMQAGLPYIRANQLWGAGAKESLHLSASTYSALTTVPSAATMGSMGASMMSNLGASTLSTLESFVQLPSAKSLPWAKNVPGSLSKNNTSDKSNDMEDQDSQSGEEAISDDAAALGGKHFNSALIMLSYDIAYLAHLQGVKVDLIMTAGSCLRVLFKAIQSAELGKRSHASHHLPSAMSNLQFSSLDFAQLLQIHEPRSNVDHDSSRRKATSAAIMEGSYVDAKMAAESILNVQKPESNAVSSTRSAKMITPRAPAVVSKPENMSSLAAKRIPSSLPTLSKQKEKKPSQVETLASPVKALNTPPPNTLDFLRVRSHKEQRGATKPPAEVESNANHYQEGATHPVAPAASGVITFNGKEIRGKAKTGGTSKGDNRSKSDEDGWHVL